MSYTRPLELLLWGYKLYCTVKCTDVILIIIIIKQNLRSLKYTVNIYILNNKHYILHILDQDMFHVHCICEGYRTGWWSYVKCSHR